MVGVGLSVREVAVDDRKLETQGLVEGASWTGGVQIRPVSPHGGRRGGKATASMWPLGNWCRMGESGCIGVVGSWLGHYMASCGSKLCGRKGVAVRWRSCNLWFRMVRKVFRSK